MGATDWVETVFDMTDPEQAWENIFARLKDLAMSSPSYVDLHDRTVSVDRLLSEGAWELWNLYMDKAPKTSKKLVEWCHEPSASGKAVLVLDALSLREMPFILGGAESRGIKPVCVGATGSEVPSDTDHFAHALGVASRSSLSNNGASSCFTLFDREVFTDVLNFPFEDCLGSVPNEKNVFIWHTWLDDLIHVHKKAPDHISKLASETLQGDGFWKFLDRLRQGRKLLITADHGYATSRLFSSEEIDQEVIQVLRETFGASRYKAASRRWEKRFMPPIVLTHNNFHVVMGQRKWTVQGGFPQICHGGLSLLEVAVPFLELPSI